jgi:hypothetical protein
MYTWCVQRLLLGRYNMHNRLQLACWYGYQFTHMCLQDDHTALMEACEGGHTAVMALLVKAPGIAVNLAERWVMLLACMGPALTGQAHG